MTPGRTLRIGVGVLSLALLFPVVGNASTKKEREAVVTKALSLMKEGRYEEAILQWERALPSEAPAKELSRGLPLLGLCYERLENFPKAITAYQQALRLNEKNINRLLDMARIYARVELDREAIELYKHVLSRDKSRHDARLSLARLYVKIGRWDEARREAESYASWEPRDLAVQRLLAEVDEAQGLLSSAGNRWEQVLARESSPEGYYALGRLWFRAARWDAADKAFSRSEELGMRTGAVYLHRGVVQWLKGDVASAREFWRKALERYPGMGAAYFFLAAVDQDAGKRAKAAAQARQAELGAKSEFLRGLLKDFSGTKQ